jgi:hypothetical protein
VLEPPPQAETATLKIAQSKEKRLSMSQYRFDVRRL